VTRKTRFRKKGKKLAVEQFNNILISIRSLSFSVQLSGSVALTRSGTGAPRHGLGLRSALKYYQPLKCTTKMLAVRTIAATTSLWCPARSTAGGTATWNDSLTYCERDEERWRQIGGISGREAHQHVFSRKSSHICGGKEMFERAVEPRQKEWRL
jgi:hypothetical protein